MATKRPLANWFLSATLLTPTQANGGSLMVDEPTDKNTVVAPNMRGAGLRKILRENYRPKNVLSYHDAREQLFTNVDNYEGMVTMIYTGEKEAVHGIPSSNKINTEHVFPQSRFHLGRIKSDMHHLRASGSKVNAVRGNKPFADIPDDKTEGWYKSEKVENKPHGNIDAFSESTKKEFEPRESVKGDIARAMTYVYVIYDDGVDKQWAEAQLATLKRWHKQDPVDADEYTRNSRVKKFQGNDNPFILDSSLVDRALEDIVTARAKQDDQAQAGNMGKILSMVGVSHASKNATSSVPFDRNNPNTRIRFIGLSEAIAMMKNPRRGMVDMAQSTGRA